MIIIYYHLPKIHSSTPQCPHQRGSINLKPLTLFLATWLTLVNEVCVDMAHATLEQRTIGLPPSAMKRRQLIFQPRCHNGRPVVQAQSPEWRANLNLMHRLGRTAKRPIDPWAKLKQLMFYLSHQDFECVCPYSKSWLWSYNLLPKTKIFLGRKRGEINNHIDKRLYPGLSRPMVTLHSESYLSSELIRLVQYGLSGFTWHWQHAK